MAIDKSRDGYWERRLGERKDSPTIVIDPGNGHTYEIEHYTHGYELHHYRPKKPTTLHPKPDGLAKGTTYHGTALSAAMKAADLELQHTGVAGDAATVAEVIRSEMEKTRTAIIEAMGLEHVPTKPNTEQPSALVPQMTGNIPYEKWKARGWSDDQLISAGHMRPLT